MEITTHDVPLFLQSYMILLLKKGGWGVVLLAKPIDSSGELLLPGLHISKSTSLSI